MSEEQEVVRFKAYVRKIEEASRLLREEWTLISRRLVQDRQRRDPRAHARAYNEISRLVRTVLRDIPVMAPAFPLFERPEKVVRAVSQIRDEGAPIPLVNSAGAIFMGCPKCDEWVDVTRVFAEGIFDGIYRCPNRHEIMFGGLSKRVEPERPPIPAYGGAETA